MCLCVCLCVCVSVCVCVCVCTARGPCYYVLLLFNRTAVRVSSRLQRRHGLPGNCPPIGPLSTSLRPIARATQWGSEWGRKTQQRARGQKPTVRKFARKKKRKEKRLRKQHVSVGTERNERGRSLKFQSLFKQIHRKLGEVHKSCLLFIPALYLHFYL